VVEFVHQNTKAVGYTVLLAAGAYYVLAFLSWGYRNQINALGEEEEAPVADQQELASEFTAAASRYDVPKLIHPSRIAASAIILIYVECDVSVLIQPCRAFGQFLSNSSGISREQALWASQDGRGARTLGRAIRRRRLWSALVGVESQ
jgi:hypothetical protein